MHRLQDTVILINKYEPEKDTNRCRSEDSAGELYLQRVLGKILSPLAVGARWIIIFILKFVFPSLSLWKDFLLVDLGEFVGTALTE